MSQPCAGQIWLLIIKLCSNLKNQYREKMHPWAIWTQSWTQSKTCLRGIISQPLLLILKVMFITLQYFDPLQPAVQIKEWDQDEQRKLGEQIWHWGLLRKVQVIVCFWGHLFMFYIWLLLLGSEKQIWLCLLPLWRYFRLIFGNLRRSIY